MTLDESVTQPTTTEASRLLGQAEAEAAEHKIPTEQAWQHEIKIIAQYSAPLILALLLQYSLSASSIFIVGHLGKHELGAVSLANMTAVITGYCVYMGFSTSLDTLCPQAYGSGNKTLVGLHLQRLTLFLLLITLPIGMLWLNADRIFLAILPSEDHETALLAGLYLKIILLGAPGYACFEAGKRFVQAQGQFTVCMLLLLICAPLNVLIGWLFVWKLQWGFIGAPIAVAITNNLLPLLLALYVYFIRGSECWHPISAQIWTNWAPMLRLAIPSWLMMEAEFIAWEIMTLASSHLGATELAAQSALATSTTFAYYISFSVAVAGGTRIACHIGAGSLRRAVTATKVALAAALGVGLLNLIVLMALRGVIPGLFSGNPDVCRGIFSVLPLLAVLQIQDALAAMLNAVLRALGRPDLGSYVQIPVYYLFALPLALGLAFGLHWSVMGLWMGLTLGQLLVVFIEGFVSWCLVDWEKAVWDASRRNTL